MGPANLQLSAAKNEALLNGRDAGQVFQPGLKRPNHVPLGDVHLDFLARERTKHGDGVLLV